MRIDMKKYVTVQNARSDEKLLNDDKQKQLHNTHTQ